MNAITKVRNIFLGEKRVEKPGTKEAQRLAKKAGEANNKEFVSMLRLVLNKAYHVGQEEAMLTSNSKDKTYMIALISMLLNGVIMFMFINQFYM